MIHIHLYFACLHTHQASGPSLGDQPPHFAIRKPSTASSSSLANKNPTATPPSLEFSFSPRAAFDSSTSNPWDSFYQLHNSSFFKDRHYFTKEHPFLLDLLTTPNSTFRILDFGCGVGNSILPLLELARCRVEYLGLDVSPHAVGLLNSRLEPFSALHRTDCKVLDLANCSQSEWDDAIASLSNSTDGAFMGFDVCLMVFTLSAFPPERMEQSLTRVSKVMRNGGRVIFRDYSQGDLSMERFASGQKLGRNLFLRQDGTTSFFFSPNGLLSLFSTANFKCLWIRNLFKTIENRQRRLQMERAWIGAEFAALSLNL
jgi:SAM-dependent methyltransferase